MKHNKHNLVLLLAQLCLALSAAEMCSAEERSTKLGRQLAKITYSKQKIMQIVDHQLSKQSGPITPGYMKELLGPTIEKHFDLSRVEEGIAGTYAHQFSEQELEEILKFYQTQVGKTLLIVTADDERKKKLQPAKASSSQDTTRNRQALAEQLMKMLFNKNKYLADMEFQMSGLSAMERKMFLDTAKRNLEDKTRVTLMLVKRAAELTAVMTSDQLSQAVTFYTSDPGKRLLEKVRNVDGGVDQTVFMELMRVTEKFSEDVKAEISK